MKRIFIVLCLLFTGMLPSLGATELKEVEVEKSHLRILELLPNLLHPLAIEPAIPADFVALSPKGSPNIERGIYWGKENVLKEYFENPDSLKEPILVVHVSSAVVQNGATSFKGTERDIEFLKNANKEEFTSFKTQWGTFPVLAVASKWAGKSVCMAWVGLNSPEGWTLVFNLVTPSRKVYPDEKSQIFWQNFLTQTQVLQDGDFFKALGQDLQEGYTLVNKIGVQLKVTAEKRISDGAIQVVVISENEGVEFLCSNIREGLMGAKWKYQQPLLKVDGRTIATKGNSSFILDSVVSILLKNVVEFSSTKEIDQKQILFQKIRK